MRVKEIEKLYQSRLAERYDDAQAQSLFEFAAEYLLDISRAQLFLQAGKELNQQDLDRLQEALERLLTGMPVQYAVEGCWFYGLRFKVNPAVLIPRPETEELVNLILRRAGEKKSLLDLGTGSGCIPIAVKKNRPEMEVHALDLSLDALALARENAQRQNCAIHFFKADLLQGATEIGERKFDVMVSNPPYITPSEAKDMEANVLDFEPHIALFIPEENPLLFYERIAELAKKHLRGGGFLFFEINRKFGARLRARLEVMGFKNIVVYQDMHGADRLVEAQL